MLLTTLKLIHQANVLHGDIRLSNLCITALGEAAIIDFSHATRSHSEKEKDREIKELSRILEYFPAKPAAKDVERPSVEDMEKPAVKDVEKPVLRRSVHIKELEPKANVEWVKHGQFENKSG